MKDNNVDIFTAALKRGMEAYKRLEENEAFVVYYLEQAKEAFEEFFEHDFSISKRRDNDLIIELIVKLKGKDKEHVIVGVLFNEDAIDSLHSDFKPAQYKSRRENLIDYINCVLKDNNKMYGILG